MTRTTLAYAHPAWLSVALALSLAACSSETGIIIEVSKDTLAAEPDSLRFYVGQEVDDLQLEIPGCGLATRFQDDAPLADRVVSIADRDLTASPYRLMLRPGVDLPMTSDLVVVVVALSGDDVVGVGAIDGRINFVDGQVLSWPVTVSNSEDRKVHVTQNGCLCNATTTGNAIAITPTDDADCDGDVLAVDCDENNPLVGESQDEICGNLIDDDCDDGIDEKEDLDGDFFFTCDDSGFVDCDDDNAEVYPGAPELCDGLDNDCVAGNERHPSSVDCYVTRDDSTNLEACVMGKRACNDNDPENGGWQTACEPLGDEPFFEGSRDFCEAFETCTDFVDYQDSYACADDEVLWPNEYYCHLAVQVMPEQGTYRPCLGGVVLGEFQFQADCKWTLMGGIEQDGYSVRLHNVNLPTDDGAVVNACEVRLNILDITTQAPDEPGFARFKLWSEVDGEPFEHARINLEPDRMDPGELCPITGGLTCEFLPKVPPMPAPAH